VLLVADAVCYRSFMANTPRVRLRPVAAEDLDTLEAMFSDREAIGPFNWAGWRDPRHWRRRFAETALLDDDPRVLIIETVAGENVGFVSWVSAHPGRRFECWSIGISLWPHARGQGYGTEAQQQLVRYLFAHTQVNRVQATTNIANVAEQRSLEKAGFTKEGVLRGIVFHEGAWRDQVIYGILRAEVP
jgi:RimJ/RimL family protein N-acetyltransferase